MKVSVVVPVYNEEGNLPELIDAPLGRHGRASARPYELVFVDDGSRDRSLEILEAAARERPGRMRVLELARNFGQHQAILAAFENVTGDVVVTLDADLQNPPEEIPKLLAKFDEGYDVVGGVRQNRQDSFLRKAASRLVNRATTLITRMRLTDFGCMLRAYSRDVVEEINRCDEASTFIPALGQSFARRPTEVAGRPCRAAARGLALLAVPADPPQLRPHDRLLARAAAGLRADGDGRRRRRRGLRPLPVRAPPHRRRRSRGRLHALRDSLHAARHRDGRARSRRRVRRPDLPPGPRTPALPRAPGPRGGDRSPIEARDGRDATLDPAR